MLFDEPKRPTPSSRFFDKKLQGASQRDQELGFELKTMNVGPGTISLRELDSLLQRLRVYGVIVLPVWSKPDFAHFDWSKYASIYADYVIDSPKIHTVCCDHYQSIFTSLEKLATRGYRRSGLFLKAT